MAAAYSSFLRLPSWWLYIQALLPPMIAAGLVLQLPAWSYLVPFALSVLVFWNSADDRVPLYLSNEITARALLEEMGEASNGHFYDLGCGPAGTLLQLAKSRPDWQFVGVETSPALWLLAWLRTQISGVKNVSIFRQNLWNTTLSEADVIYAFLSPAPMPKLYEKARSEMKPGSKLISNSFEIPSVPADEIKQLQDDRQTKLLIWHFQ